jgi:N-acetylglucosaminyldiphosphoundecaprenol N-acetyl-beta-D-mannosaminyltransferase
MELQASRKQTITTYKFTRLLGVKIGDLPVDQFISKIAERVLANKRVIAAYINVHALNLAHDQPWFEEFLNKVPMTYCDGYGVMLGARILGLPLKNRHTPSDWIDTLAATCARGGISVYFLGARPGVALKAAKKIKEKFPSLKIKGVQHGYFDKTSSSEDNEAVIRAINNTDPDILLVGLGMPLQEQWLLDNWGKLQVRAALPVGALFDYMSGTRHRAPRWMANHGFEWLWRLLLEPGRLGKRYVLGIPRYLGRVIRELLRQISGY